MVQLVSASIIILDDILTLLVMHPLAESSMNYQIAAGIAAGVGTYWRVKMAHSTLMKTECAYPSAIFIVIAQQALSNSSLSQ